MPTYVSGSVKEGDTLINKLGSKKQASPISQLLGKDAGDFTVKGTNQRKGMFLRRVHGTWYKNSIQHLVLFTAKSEIQFVALLVSRYFF